MTAKISKIFIASTIGFLCATSSALAVMRVPFPNSSTLQPLPKNIQPNITSNVNSVTASSSFASDQPLVTGTEDQSGKGANTSVGSGISSYFYIGILVGLISVFLFRYFLKKK